MVASLTQNLSNNYNYRLSVLNNVVNTHGLEEYPRTNGMRNSYRRDFERLTSKIEQLADQRKASLDREKANAAQSIYDEARERVTKAGTAIATQE